MIINPDDHGVLLLNTPEEKIDLMKSSGVDHLIIHPFSTEFAKLDAGSFIADILVKQLNTYKLVIGYDHRFGNNRQGSFTDLVRKASEFGFEVEKIPEQDVDDIAVSSTRVRRALREGEIDIANKLLGSNYKLSGKVVKGKQLGRQLGFPTANIQVVDYKLIPVQGVYICNVYIEHKEFKGLLSIGTRPTVESAGLLSVEVFIMDFSNDIYDQFITVEIMHRIRADIKFENLEELKNQMNADLEFAKSYFESK
jgi:riboflavin kinase/FMN adenylyltransferase